MPLLRAEPPPQVAVARGSEDVVILEPLEVSETGTDPLAPLNAAGAAARLAGVSGGTSLVDPAQLSAGRVANVADALRFQPGVTAQSASGGEAVRLTLRGSGLVRGPTAFGQGVQVLFDGLPLASATGNPYESTEPLFANYIEVLRGSNSFQYGPLSLGGVVNYVTNTGYDAPGVRIRGEVGEDGYRKGLVSQGVVEGPWDYYAAVSAFEYDGFRDDSASGSTRLVFNGGYQAGERVSTRLNLRHAAQRQDNPGNLTYAQLLEDRTRAQNPGVLTTRENRGSTTVSSLTRVALDPDSSLRFGVQFKDYPVTNVGGPTPTDFDFKDLVSDLAYSREDTLFDDRRSLTTLSLKYGLQIDSGTTGTNAAGVRTYETTYDGHDWILQAENQFELAPRLWLETGLAGLWQKRDTEIVFANNTVTDPKRVSDYVNIAPRAGLRFDLRPEVQFYANYSRSVEAPITINYTRSIGGVQRATIPLGEQVADTVEFGTRGRRGIFAWDLSVYRSEVEDELLSVNITPGAPTATVVTSNASPTIHQGVEAALETTLYESAAPAADGSSSTAASAGAPERDRLVFRQSYTLNDFSFENDPAFGDNNLAGVYRQLYQAELRYQFAGGFYVATDLESALEESPADFANTIFAKPYTIYGAKIGYAPAGGRWSVFADLRNLTDKRYAAVFAPFYDANGIDRAVYSPGAGRTLTVGASVQF